MNPHFSFLDILFLSMKDNNITWFYFFRLCASSKNAAKSDGTLLSKSVVCRQIGSVDGYRQGVMYS
jgi:hypothetical protein